MRIQFQWIVFGVALIPLIYVLVRMAAAVAPKRSHSASSMVSQREASVAAAQAAAMAGFRPESQLMACRERVLGEPFNARPGR